MDKDKAPNSPARFDKVCGCILKCVLAPCWKFNSLLMTRLVPGLEGKCDTVWDHGFIYPVMQLVFLVISCQQAFVGVCYKRIILNTALFVLEKSHFASKSNKQAKEEVANGIWYTMREPFDFHTNSYPAIP